MKSLIAFIAGLVAGPALFLLAGIVGWLPSNATSEPPNWESSIGMRALDASLERRSASVENPIGAKNLGALSAGRKIYSRNCSGCHGSAQAPSEWGANGFYPRAPQFFQEGSDVNPKEAYAAIHDGIRYSGMGAWRGLMKNDDMWMVANFVAQIKSPKGAKPMTGM